MESKIERKKFGTKIITPRRICVGPAQKGLMHRFIKSRAQSLTDLNNNSCEKGSPIKSDVLLTKIGSPIISREEKKLKYHLSIYSPKPISICKNDSPSVERDVNGKPIRRGFISAKEKIQLELNDFRNREAELRERRKNSLQPDLINSINTDLNDTKESIDETSDKLKYSIPELSESVDSIFSDFNVTISPNTSFNNYHKIHKLPQRRSFPSTVKNLFDEIYSKPEEEKEEEEELMSSKKLIAKWENIIKESAKK